MSVTQSEAKWLQKGTLTFHNMIKTVPKYVFQEVIKEIPQVSVRYVERRVEVEQHMVREIPVEVPHVEQVVRRVPRVHVKEVPIELGCCIN